MPATDIPSTLQCVPVPLLTTSSIALVRSHAVESLITVCVDGLDSKITLPLWSKTFVYNTGSVYTPPFAIVAYAAHNSKLVTPYVIPPSARDWLTSLTTLPSSNVLLEIKVVIPKSST